MTPSLDELAAGEPAPPLDAVAAAGQAPPAQPPPGQPLRLTVGPRPLDPELDDLAAANEAREAAAARARQSVQPPGGRQEGAITAGLVSRGEAFKQQLADFVPELIRHPENLVGPGELRMAMPGLIGAMRQAAPAARSAAASAAGAIEQAFHPAWISQRLPTAVKATEDPLAQQLMIDTAAMRTDPNHWAQSTAAIKSYPNLSAAEKSGSPEQVAENFIRHVEENLLHLHDQVPPQIRERSRLWYDGANAIARGAAEHFGVPPQSAAGVYAALSPQKDWFQNVSLGDRAMYIRHNYQNQPFTPEMTQTAARIFGDPKYAAQLERVSQGTLASLTDPLDKAMWLRTFDQAHHDPSYQIISPEGERLAAVTNKDGSPSRVAWGSLKEIGKAIAAMESGGDRTVLSSLMGEKHKVRNFYNNILDPASPMGDVTIDTHAVAAGLLRPLAGHHVEVAHNFASYPGKDIAAVRGSAMTGAQGTYGLYADAYRRAAAQRGILPRELQSITWEAVRGLFPDVYKANPGNTAAIDDMWKRRAQDAAIEDIRRQIHEHAGGINPPDWVGR